MEERLDHDNRDERSQDESSLEQDNVVTHVFDTGREDDVEERPVKRRTGPLIVVAFVSALLGALIATFAVPYMYGSTPKDVFSGQAVQISNSKEIINVEKTAVSPVTAVARKLQPSIVNMRVKQPMSDIFHPDVVSGAGSGVIFRPDGYIITNNHVVSGAKEIFVTIGTEEVRGKLVAADKETDIAIIKVNKTGLPAAEFGSTKDLQVGELAVAIGSPFGFEHTVTSGIISALNRTVSVPDEQTGEDVTYTNLIQTDAPINPGNSGGAVSDAKGRVIGISALIISSSGVTEGVGFAIPVETAKTVAEQLIKTGKASHPYMGILGRNVEDMLSADISATTKAGAVIVDIVKGSPAEKAGLKKQDIVIAIDGQLIKGMDELIAEVRGKKVGDRIEITFMRSKKKDTTTLALIEKPRQ